MAIVMLLCSLVIAPEYPALAEQVRLKVLTYNIQSGNDRNNQRNLAPALAIMREVRPDLMTLQEVLRKDLPAIGAAAELKHHQIIVSYGIEKWRVHSGVAVFSRWPFTIKRFPLKIQSGHRFFGVATVDLDGIPLKFYAVHLSREGLADSLLKGLVREFLGKGSREEQMKSVLNQMRRDSHRFKILAGDLNTFPLSRPYRLLQDLLQDAFPSVLGDGSFRMDAVKSLRGKHLPNPKIDHIFHSRWLKATGARVIKRGVSDHYPVIAEFIIYAEDSNLSSNQVMTAQEKTQKRGLYLDQINGELTPKFRRAVARFQKSQGLWIDGILTSKTLKRLQ